MLLRNSRTFLLACKNQAEDKNIADYIAELPKVSTHCEFGDYFQQALHDCLVCGMKSESTQRNLLTLRDLSFARALEIAEGMEVAERNIHQLHRGYYAAVHSVTQPGYCWGKSNHNSNNCHFKDAICHACKKKGHLANIC